eukprot:TRINITY_DN45109_c0_g1_i1.p2 TRINITY_DN45109_c0_g1~~TRINITY_DN45109_c0_g1_i1.p2  ORF type:complete len:142 (-),score=11.09 TRINITY_DN45109_c0_g1_i1:124-549(-)
MLPTWLAATANIQSATAAPANRAASTGFWDQLHRHHIVEVRSTKRQPQKGSSSRWCFDALVLASDHNHRDELFFRNLSSGGSPTRKASAPATSKRGNGISSGIGAAQPRTTATPSVDSVPTTAALSKASIARPVVEDFPPR